MPPDRVVAKARVIRKAGGTVPKNMQPKEVGVHDLGPCVNEAAARIRAIAKARETAARYNAVVRAVNLSERGWVATISHKEKD